MEKITSQNNRWIKLAMQLKNRKARNKMGMFITEGIRNAEDLLNQNTDGVVCLIQNDKCQNQRIEKLIDRGNNLHWLFLETPELLLKKVTCTEHGQGLILIVKKKEYDKENLFRLGKKYYILLDNIRDPGNLGTMIRTASAAGCDGILLTEGCVDPYNDKTIRSSMGSILRIPIYENIDISVLETMIQKTGLPLFGTSLVDAQSYESIDTIDSGIFAFGNEGNGIRPDILKITKLNLFIPMANSVESLNVSAAAAIILFKYINKNNS